MPLPLEDSLALVVLESVTRILPVSATGHAALLGIFADVELSRGFVASAGVGTWLAVVYGLRAHFHALLESVANALRRPRERARIFARNDVRAVVLGGAAMAAVELAVRDRVVPWGRDPILVGAGWLVTAAVIASTLWAPRGTQRTLTLAGALLVGAAEGAGILPGLSQTGLALAGLAWLGMTESVAFEICFLMMVPAEGALAIVRAGELRELLPWPNLTATVLTFGVGALTLRFLRGVFERRLLSAFSLYLVPLGVATLAWGYARP